MYKILMMMNTIKCQVRLSKEVWDGWNEVLPILHHSTIYLYIYIYTFREIKREKERERERERERDSVHPHNTYLARARVYVYTCICAYVYACDNQCDIQHNTIKHNTLHVLVHERFRCGLIALTPTLHIIT